MALLRNLAKLIRSKNAGPFELTIDILFGDEETYLRVKNSGVINRHTLARIYGIDAGDVRIFNYDPALAIKASMPRWTVSGAPDDTDIFGGQQNAPLVDLEVPGENLLVPDR